MNDITSKLRKFGLWVWGQKEKMFLGVLLVVLCFRVYVVLINPPDASALDEKPKAPPVKPTPGALPPAAAPPRPVRQI
jgi:hypothetical protein